jgi:glycosyltransferase involved in cell wall biosynthesis
MIKVAQLQYSEESAGSAALKLHKAFLDNDIDSFLITFLPCERSVRNIFYLGRKSILFAWLERKIQYFITKKSLSEYGSFTYPVLGRNIADNEYINNADIIYLHWTLGGFLNLKGIEKILKLNKPVVITLHDMWMLTGGCHHSFDCRKFTEHCQSCQVFGSKRKFDLSYFSFKRKVRILSKYKRISFIAPSEWMSSNANKSAISVNKTTVRIPNILENSIFKPLSRDFARDVYNIDKDKKIIAFGAINIGSPYKGWKYLMEALIRLGTVLDPDKTEILVFGNGHFDKKPEIPFKITFTGCVKSENAMAMLYNAADVFVIPSVADNLPTTVLESLSCGTPVTGFDTGGIPDMIVHKSNGYIAKQFDSEDLANGINYCLRNNLRGFLPPFFARENVIGLHKELIHKILNV